MFDEVEKEILFISERATITIGANISAGTVLLKRYIDRFAEQYPLIKVDVRVAGSGKLRKMIYDHEVDFALVEDLVRESNLVQVPFYHDQIVFVAAPDHPKTKKKDLKLEDFAEENMLLRDKGVGVRDKFDQLMKLREVEIEPSWQSSNTRALINAAEAGYGVAVLPYLLARDEIECGRLAVLDVREADLKRNLNITYHKEKIFNKWVEDFIDIIKKDELSFC
ncbi:MAG: substrate-binding domain-containing protein [Firmicutes bacterium]|nr:substrate-binding domain-containing protein [Bacillota bacterium]